MPAAQATPLVIPPKVVEFVENFKAATANQPYFRRTFGERLGGAVRDFGGLARNVVVNRYGSEDTEGRKHFLGLSERENTGSILQILKRFAVKNPTLEAIKPKENDAPTEKDDDTPEPQTVESRAAAEETNRESMRLVQLQLDALTSIDANVKATLGVVTELKKADDRKGLEATISKSNGGSPSLFPNVFDLFSRNKAPGDAKAPRRRGNVFSRALNAGRALMTRASETFSPLKRQVTDKLTKGVELGKNTLTATKEGAKSFTQNTLRPRLGNLAEKAKTGNAQLLDVAEKTGSKGLDVAKGANNSILKMMPKNVVGKLGVVGAVAGGAMAIADYNAQAEEIDQRIARGELSEAEADAMKGNLIKKGTGSTIGAGVGTAIGSAIGSIIPGAGTIVGGMVGGWLGEKVGSWVGDAMSEDPQVALLQERVDNLNELADKGNLHWTTVRALRKQVEEANIDQDDKNDLLEQLDDLDKDAIKKGADSRTRAVLAKSSTGQAFLAQASETNMTLTPNGTETYAQAFDAKVQAPKAETGGNTTVTQVNNNSTNTTIRSGNLETRNRDASLADYRRGNFSTVG